MTRWMTVRRLFLVLGGLVLASVAGGCGSKSTITLTNVSDSWLNVQFYVKNTLASKRTPEEDAGVPAARRPFVGDDAVQIEPGSTKRYVLRRHPVYDSDAQPLVRILVEPVSPSWEPTGRQYWRELLTRPPLTVVFSGTAENLAFLTGGGRVAAIPETEVRRSRMVYQPPDENEPMK